MKSYKYIVFLLAVLTGICSAPARTLYGVTTTTWEEGNARVVSVDTDNLSSDRSSPTPFTEISTFEQASDFMAGTWANGKYYCYYNTYDQELDRSLQHFGTLSMKTGQFSLIAEENHVDSDNVTDMMDMVYDPVGGGLLGLDRQYVPSNEKFVSTIQNISMKRGTLNEVVVFDRRYVAICSDGNGGFYLATLDKNADEIYTPKFYTADNRFQISSFPVSGKSTGESSFAHSMALDDEKLYLATGSILTVVDLKDRSAESFYLEKDLYGITFEIEDDASVGTIVYDSECESEYYTLQGIRTANPQPGEIVICLKGATAKKIIAK